MRVPKLSIALLVLRLGYLQPVTTWAEQDMVWTSAPLLLPAAVKGADRRTQSLVQPVNLTTTQVMVFPPIGGGKPSEPWAAEAQAVDTFSIKGKGVGNYHWLASSSEDGKSLASSVYYFSNPGAAPRELLQQNMATLAVKPLALPREHNQYRANETWQFQTTLQGKPLSNASIRFETSNGTNQTLTTDAQGQVVLTFPDDFKTIKDAHQQHGGGHGGHGGHGMNTAQFVVSVEHEGITSAFNYKYAPDAFTNKAVLPALGFALGGMLLASPLLWRRKKA